LPWVLDAVLDGDHAPVACALPPCNQVRLLLRNRRARVRRDHDNAELPYDPDTTATRLDDHMRTVDVFDLQVTPPHIELRVHSRHQPQPAIANDTNCLIGRVIDETA